MTSHILLVDDDTSILMAYQRNLSKFYTLTTIGCPLKALEMIKSEPIFDVVVTDIQMPGMDGLTFLAKVKDHMPASSRIILSGHMNAELAMRAVNECMAFRYLTKPTSFEVLVAAIDEALDLQNDARNPSSDTNLLPKDRALLADFDRALSIGSLALHYQPKVDLRSGKVCTAEGLLRWQHPKYGAISPADFIPLVEQSGRSDKLAHWVTLEACKQAARWHFDHDLSIKVAVNLSPNNFNQSGLVEHVKTILHDTECPPELLEFEVTESLKLPAQDWLWHELCALREMGITLSVDDFGAGYSSFDHLNRLPISQLKLDSSLLSHVPSDQKSKEIVMLLVGLSHSLGLTIVAEGIETDEQATFLKDTGCDYGQGFLYSPALNARDFLEWVMANNNFLQTATNQPSDTNFTSHEAKRYPPVSVEG